MLPAIPSEVLELSMEQRLNISLTEHQLDRIRTSDKDDLIIDLLSQLCVKDNVIRFLMMEMVG